MKIIYEQTDITDFVRVKSCVLRDNAGERSDSLEIELDYAEKWYRWGPQEDDRIQVIHEGIDSGEMFLHSILPENGAFRIRATALPCRARKKENRSYIGNSLEEILRRCAMGCGMGYALYGLDKSLVYPYWQQEAEGSAAFLSRLLRAEGAVLKCVNGKFRAIGIPYAQDRPALQSLRIEAEQDGFAYSRTGEVIRTLTVRTPWATATAEDSAAEGRRDATVEDLPARNAVQAGRWARGMLLHQNRVCECVSLQTEMNKGFSALARIDISGGTNADGEWLIQEAEHDLIQESTSVRMLRCIRTIR